MADMDPELVKKEMIGAFELIKELNENPDMLKRLPRHSKLVYRGKKRMFVSTEKNGKTLLL